MKVRRIVSLTVLSSFVLLALTGIVLFVAPHGRVAFWVDWRLWGLTKTEWSNIHINIGILFLSGGLLHIKYNWNAIESYLKNRAKHLRVFTREFNIALLLTFTFTVSTYIGLPPLTWVPDLGESIKSRMGEEYGEPPYGHAERSSLRIFAKRVGLDLGEIVENLKRAGVQLGGVDRTVQEIAQLNHLSPQQVYTKMKPISHGAK